MRYGFEAIPTSFVAVCKEGATGDEVDGGENVSSWVCCRIGDFSRSLGKDVGTSAPAEDPDFEDPQSDFVQPIGSRKDKVVIAIISLYVVLPMLLE